METALAVAPEIGLAPACRALGVSRATAYRHRVPRPKAERRPRPKPVLALSEEERLATSSMCSTASASSTTHPAQVYATLLDEGTYLASERTMYRILAAQGESRERRAQLRHPAYASAGAAGHRAEPALELGHHQAQGPGEVDLLLPLRAARRLQSLRPRLAAGAPRERHARRPAHRRDRREGGHHRWPHHPCRPGARR